MKIALIQPNLISSFPERLQSIKKIANYKEKLTRNDIDLNRKQFLEMVKVASQQGADIAVGSESILEGWSFNKTTIELSAVTLESHEIQEILSVARDNEIWICAGLFIRRHDGIYNSAVLISSSGAIVGCYDKVHETPEVIEAIGYTLGNTFPVFDTPFGKTGMLICHDRWYPEAFRSLRLKGAKLILIPVAAGICHHSHTWYDMHKAMLRTRAYENRVMIVIANSANHGGHSFIIYPEGTVVFESKMTEGVYVVNVDFDNTAGYDFISSRRPETYFK